MATESLTLTNGDVIQYRLERKKRKTIGLKITEEGLIVHAPQRIATFQLQAVLTKKSDWISKKLKARQENYMPPVIWQDDETLLFMGKPITLQIIESRKRKTHLEHDVLTVNVSDTQDKSAIQRKVMQWYKQEALQDFSRRLEIFAAKLGVPTPRLTISNAKSRWGSCNSEGHIRLSWRLLQAPPHLINYVTCHELAHLKEMNHSARFWAVVASLYPDYKHAEQELKQQSAQLHRL